MRTPWIVCAAMTLAVVAVSCRFPSDTPSPSCEDDSDLCPKSSKAATSVTCDCRCTVGLGEDSGETYEGRVAVCLPPELNTMVASGEVRTGLQALDARVFDQRVFQYCSEDVASFLRASVRAPIGLRACAVPMHCECTTTGALHDSAACHSDCQDVACTKENCPGLLWRNARLDASACRCSRASACGSTSPVAERHGVCRDWLTPTDAPAAEGPQ